MHPLPTRDTILAPFVHFPHYVSQNAQLLLIGAFPRPGQRTVCSALRAVGLDERTLPSLPSGVRRAWSSLKASHLAVQDCSLRMHARG